MLVRQGIILVLLPLVVFAVEYSFNGVNGLQNLATSSVDGGQYGHFCYGFSSVWEKYMGRIQSIGTTYAACEVIVGNLVLSYVDKMDLSHIKEVTGYVLINLDGIDVNSQGVLNLSGLKVIHGQELGTGLYDKAALIIIGNNNKGTSINFNTDLKVVRGNVYAEGDLGCQFEESLCSIDDEMTAIVAPEYTFLSKVVARSGCGNATNCFKFSETPSASQVCRDGEFRQADGTCGACDKFTINQFCVNKCPVESLEHGKTCVFTCPPGYSYDPRKGDYKCVSCRPSVDPDTNQWGTSDCPRGCFIGYRSYFTYIQLREIYPNVELGPMRQFESDGSNFCGYLYGNFKFESVAETKDKLPGHFLKVLSHVVATTGFMEINSGVAFVPFGIFRSLEYATLGVKTSVKTDGINVMLDLNRYKAGNSADGRNKFKTQFGALPDANYTEAGTTLSNIPGLTCSSGDYYPKFFPNELHHFCGTAGDDTYKISNKVYGACHRWCSPRCTGSSASECAGCRGFELTTYNVMTCVRACPYGYYLKDIICRKCSTHCGRYGCYGGGHQLSGDDKSNGCEKCEITVLAEDDVGNYVSTCVKAATSNDNFIEKAFQKHLTGASK